MKKTKQCLAFIDAANLMYGGQKSLGWSIDYQKLLQYLRTKYHVTTAHYYAGVDICGYAYDPLSEYEVDVQKLTSYLSSLLSKKSIDEQALTNIKKSLKQLNFYAKLDKFGYQLHLKPVKIFKNGNKVVKKANCDVDMTFDLMRLADTYSDLLVLSGDGDFFVVLNYLRTVQSKNINILSRSERTAKEIKRLAGGRFLDFHYLREQIKLADKKERHPYRMPSTSVKRNIPRNKGIVK